MRILASFAIVLISCVTSVSQFSSQSDTSVLNLIAVALRQPAAKVLITANPRSAISSTTISLVSSGGEKNPLTLVWGVFPRDSLTLRVCSVQKIGPANSLYETYSPRNALAVVNGGFYGYDVSKRGTPVGLLISDGDRLSTIASSWISGGILLVRDESNVEIIPITRKNDLGSPKEALQSKPLLFENGVRAVKRDRTDQPFNRSAIGLTDKNDLFIAGVFTEDNQALTLYDFSKVLTLLKELQGIRIQTALNLDGATDAHFYVPSPARHWGYAGSNYIPDVLAIVPR